MCMFKSGIILKDRVFIPDYDSHTDMLEELKIEDNTKNAESLFVRAELTPKNNDVFSSVDDWVFKVDQDIIPDWFVREVEEQRMKDAVKEWAKTHIHIGVDNLVIDRGASHYIKDCKDVKISGSASVENIYDSATVKNICGSARVKYICGSATVKNICGSASVKYIYGSATVENIYGSASVENIYDSATVEYICGSATVISSPFTDWYNKSNVILTDNATFKDNYSKVIWQSGNYELRAVESEV